MKVVTEPEPLLMHHRGRSRIPWVNLPWVGLPRSPRQGVQHRFYEHQEEHMHSDLERQLHIYVYRMIKSSITMCKKHALVLLIGTTVINESSFFCNMGVIGGSL